MPRIPRLVPLAQKPHDRFLLPKNPTIASFSAAGLLRRPPAQRRVYRQEQVVVQRVGRHQRLYGRASHSKLGLPSSKPGSRLLRSSRDPSYSSTTDRMQALSLCNLTTRWCLPSPIGRCGLPLPAVEPIRPTPTHLLPCRQPPSQLCPRVACAEGEDELVDSRRHVHLRAVSTLGPERHRAGAGRAWRDRGSRGAPHISCMLAKKKRRVAATATRLLTWLSLVRPLQ
jgi:hypothetical protein